jgi:hypothetical protein
MISITTLNIRIDHEHQNWAIVDETGDSVLVSYGHFEDGGCKTVIDGDDHGQEDFIYNLVRYALGDI